jgi:hypothetical protein
MTVSGMPRPDGQIIFGKSETNFVDLSSPLLKNISLFVDPKSPPNNIHPGPTEGRFANVTNAGQDAMDAGGLFDE